METCTDDALVVALVDGARVLGCEDAARVLLDGGIVAQAELAIDDGERKSDNREKKETRVGRGLADFS